MIHELHIPSKDQKTKSTFAQVLYKLNDGCLCHYKPSEFRRALRLPRSKSLSKMSSVATPATASNSVAKCHPTTSMPRKQYRPRRRSGRGMRSMKRSIKKLKAEMQVIDEEHKTIKEDQMEVRQKLATIGAQCDQLKKETQLISQQSSRTRLRLYLMFQILKARSECNLAKATNLITSLRDLIGKQCKQK